MSKQQNVIVSERPSVMNRTSASSGIESGARSVVGQPVYRIVHALPDPETESAWREFLQRADFPTHYVSPEFFREPFFVDMRPFAVLVSVDGRVMAVVTGIHERKGLVCGVTGRPQLAMDPGCANVVTESLLQGLRREAAGEELITVFAWSQISLFTAGGFSEQREQATVMLDLRLGEHALFKQLAKGRKSDVKFALREGIEIRLATTQEEFDAFYQIYA